MGDLQPLLKHGASEAELAILRSAEGDVPSPLAQKQTLAALGLATTVASTSLVALAGSKLAKSVAAMSKATLAKWLSVFVLGGSVTVTVAASGVLAPFSASRTPQPAAARATRANLLAPSTVPLTRNEGKPREVLSHSHAPALETLRAKVDTPRALQKSTAPAATATSSAVSTATATATASSNQTQIGTEPPAPSASALKTSLATEIASLESARDVLLGGDISRALTSLDRHDTEFPRGALREESTILRIQALLRKGDRVGATRLAERISPKGPYAQRVKQLISNL